MLNEDPSMHRESFILGALTNVLILRSFSSFCFLCGPCAAKRTSDVVLASLEGSSVILNLSISFHVELPFKRMKKFSFLEKSLSEVFLSPFLISGKN